MIKKSAVFLTAFIILTLLGCPEISNTQFTYDPDPVDDPTLLPDPAEDLYIVANIDGTIYGFDLSDPLNYTILATNVSIIENFSEIRISPDLAHLLYAKVIGVTQTDLVLLKLNSPIEEGVNPITIDTGIRSNESEFINDTSLIFNDDGIISVYDFENNPGTKHDLVPRNDGKCNHWAQLSPDLGKIVYKDQEPSVENEAFHTWSNVTLSDTFDDYLELSPSPYAGSVNLYDYFFYSWRERSFP